ncbi:MAG: VanW family protein [Lachnospiraceae bacterium]
MRMKRWLRRISALAAAVLMLTGVFCYSPKAEEVINLILNYDTIVYTRQIYSPEVTQINSGADTDAIKWVKETCNHVAYITNGGVTLDAASLTSAVKGKLASGSKSITFNLSDYTTQAVAAKAAQAQLQALADAQKAQAQIVQPQAADEGMNAATAASLNEIGIDTKISECITSYVAGQDRSLNIEVAANRINGLILQPGQLFSYDKAILPRTSANGYGPGNAIISGKYEKVTGGGICQVSSTLNNAVLRAGILPTERYNHSQQVHYLKSGLDATVSSGRMDYQFINTLQYPVYISAVAANGKMTVSFYSNSAALSGMTFQTYVDGTEKKNTTYVVGYLDGIEVSRVKAYSSSYK